MKKKGKPRNPLGIFIFLLLISLAGYFGYWQIISFLPNSEEIPFRQYYGLDGEAYIVLEDKLITDGDLPAESGGELLLPVGFAHDNLDKYIFWEPDSARITITDDYNVIRISSDTPYISSLFLAERYGADIKHNKNSGIVTVDYKEQSRTISRVASKAAAMRYEPDKKSPIAEHLQAGAEVITYGAQGNYTLVRTADGYLGYVLTKALEFYKETEKAAPVEEVPYVHSPVTETGKINILWEQVFNEKQSASSSRIARDGLDVVCPTWLLLNGDMSGDITCIADLGYVEWAHANGMSVWALLGANWSDDLGAVLRDSYKREHVIEQLMNFISVYKLDGINIDFETVQSADGKYFVQFIRELAPFMKRSGAILSVDMYVPKPHNLFYNRTEVGKSADYIIIMGYDEFWRTSPVSGPVASINFVDEGITETLKEVPKEKVILGVPYYNRVWTETDTPDGVNVTGNDYGMTYPYNYFTERGIEFEWDDGLKNYYAEFSGTENGESFTKKLWLEDERSLEEKLKLAVKYDLAGVAGWKKGLEKESVWGLLYKYLKNESGSVSMTDISIDTKEFSFEEQMTYKDVDVLGYSAVYPQFFVDGYSGQLAAINSFYEEKALEFQARCIRELYGMAADHFAYAENYSLEGHFRPYEARSQFYQTYNQGGIISLYTDKYEFTGGAHGGTLRSSETWNTDTGKRLTMESFLPTMTRDGVIAEITAQAGRRRESLHENYEELIAACFNDESFYVTPRAVVVYFQEYAVAPYAAGIVEFEIDIKANQ